MASPLSPSASLSDSLEGRGKEELTGLMEVSVSVGNHLNLVYLNNDVRVEPGRKERELGPETHTLYPSPKGSISEDGWSLQQL